MNNETKMARRVIMNGEKLLLHDHIEELVVMENGWKGREWRVLDLSFMPKLRLLEVGDKCFEYVDDVRLIGLNRLERGVSRSIRMIGVMMQTVLSL